MSLRRFYAHAAIDSINQSISQSISQSENASDRLDSARGNRRWTDLDQERVSRDSLDGHDQEGAQREPLACRMAHGNVVQLSELLVALEQLLYQRGRVPDLLAVRQVDLHEWELLASDGG